MHHTKDDVDDAVEEYLATVGRDKAGQEVAEVYEGIIQAFHTQWDDVNLLKVTPGDLRKKYLFPHGLGWVALAGAAGELIAVHGDDWKNRFTKAVESFDWSRGAEVWAGNVTILNPDTNEYRVNNTGPAIKWLTRTIVNAA